MFTVTPCKTSNSLLICARIDALFFTDSGSNATSISELLGGSACSSSSARPVRRAVNNTPGTFKICCSAMLPILFDSSNEVLAGVERFIVKLPSLNAGKNSVPKNGTIAAAPITNAVATPIITFGRCKPQANSLLSFIFNHLTSLLSSFSGTAAVLIAVAGNTSSAVAFGFFQNKRFTCFKLLRDPSK